MAKQKLLAPVHPNAGLEVAYQKKIDALIDAMHKSVNWWVMAAYRANLPEMAMDASEKIPQIIAKAIEHDVCPLPCQSFRNTKTYTT